MVNEIRALTKGLSIFNDYQSTYNGERRYQFKESYENYNQGSNHYKHQRTQFPQNFYICGSVFDQSSNLIIYQNSYIVEKVNKDSECDKSLNQSLNVIVTTRIFIVVR